MSTKATSGHAADEAGWRNFAVRHGLTFFWQTHGALPGAHGELEGRSLSVCGRVAGIELIGIQSLPTTFELVLCDALFAEWCLEPSRVDSAEKGHAATAKNLHLRYASAAALAYLLPHRYAGVAMDSGDPALDERYKALAHNGPLELAPPAIRALLRLPSPAQVAAFAGNFHAFFPGAPVSDELLDAFRVAWRSIGGL